MSYKIEFTDNTYFYGGDLQNSKWNEMPNKPIIKLTYFYAKHKIVLEGYEAYNHVVEQASRFQSNSLTLTLTPTIMVKKGNDVLKLTFNQLKGKFIWDVTEFGKEWRGYSHSGWKIGILGGKPKSKIV